MGNLIGCLVDDSFWLKVKLKSYELVGLLKSG